MSPAKIPRLIWENWIKPLSMYAILWAGFRYWLDFGNTQSIVFAFLFGSCYFGFKDLSKKTERAEDFIPYRVSIGIYNPRDLLFKYNFAKTEEDWNQICEQIKDTSIFRRGLSFTVLSLSKEGLPHLIWWDDYKAFLAGIPSFEDAIQGLEFQSEFSFDRKWSPRLYFGFRHGKGRGYNLALCVRDKWWEKNKTENIETEKEYHTGSVYMILGTLPYGELGLDYEARHQDRKTELEKLGWTIKDSHEPELDWHNIEVQNEYFSVSQRFCETD
jgi:hypothetical protein